MEISVLVGLYPECRGIVSKRVNFETFNDADIACCVYFKTILTLIIDHFRAKEMPTARQMLTVGFLLGNDYILYMYAIINI